MSNAMKAILTKFAKSDLKLAAKHGRIGVSQTKQGHMELTCGVDKETFTLTAKTGVIAFGKAPVMIEALIAAYDVVQS